MIQREKIPEEKCRRERKNRANQQRENDKKEREKERRNFYRESQREKEHTAQGEFRSLLLFFLFEFGFDLLGLEKWEVRAGRELKNKKIEIENSKIKNNNKFSSFFFFVKKNQLEKKLIRKVY